MHRVENGRHGKTQWMCQCVCGARKVVTTNSLVTNNSTSCGCNNTRDLTGQTFGDVRVVGPDYSTGRRAWTCSCRCGALFVTSCGMLCRKSHTTCGTSDRCRVPRALPDVLRSVMVVEDDFDLSASLEEAFREEGWKTCCKASSDEALDAVREHDFDAIVTDLMMPSMNGIQLCEKVLAFRPTMSVVVITGNATVKGAVDSLQAGAFDFVTKPFDVCDFFSTVKRAVQRKRPG